jgi:hypothetical protein
MLRGIASGLRSPLRGEWVEGELVEELRDFLGMAAAEKMNGMSRDEALGAVTLKPQPDFTSPLREERYGLPLFR